MLPKIGKLLHPLGHAKVAPPRVVTQFAALLRSSAKSSPPAIAPPRNGPELLRAEEAPRKARERDDEREESPPCVTPFPATMPTMEEPIARPIAIATPAVVESAAAVTTQTLAPELLDQAAFWGDGARGVARLRFGSRAKGALRGATVTLEHDGEALSLRVEGDTELAEALRERLAKRGLPIED